MMKASHSTLLILSGVLLSAGCNGDGGNSTGSGGSGGEGSNVSHSQPGTNGGGKKTEAPHELDGVWQVVDVDFGYRNSGEPGASKKGASNQPDEARPKSSPDRVQYVQPTGRPLLRPRDRCWISGGWLIVCRPPSPYRPSTPDRSHEDDRPPPFLKKVQAARFKLNTKPQPWQIDFLPEEEDDWLVRGLCKVQDDTLKLCAARSENARPSKLATDRREGSYLYVLERVAPLPRGYEQEPQSGEDDPLLVTSFATLGVTLGSDAEGRVRELAVSTFGEDGKIIESADFTDKDLERLQRLKGLRRLDLRGSQVTSMGLKGLAEWPRLEVLRLDSLPVTDETMAIIGQLERLQGLSIRGTYVTDAGLEQLADLKYLHLLDPPRRQHQLPRPALSALRKALPHLVLIQHREDNPSNGGTNRPDNSPRQDGQPREGQPRNDGKNGQTNQPNGKRKPGLLPTLPEQPQSPPNRPQ